MKSTIRSGKGGAGNRLSINVLEMTGMAMTAYVMTVIRKDRPAKENRVGDDEGRQFVGCAEGNYLRGGQGEERNRGDKRIIGVWKRIMRCILHAKHARGMENDLAKKITRWAEDDIPTMMTDDFPIVSWQAQELGSGWNGDVSREYSRGYTLGQLSLIHI